MRVTHRSARVSSNAIICLLYNFLFIPNYRNAVSRARHRGRVAYNVNERKEQKIYTKKAISLLQQAGDTYVWAVAFRSNAVRVQRRLTHVPHGLARRGWGTRRDCSESQ